MRVKSREKPFDLDVGLAIVERMAESEMNTLVIDCSDGVKYACHPELARPYSISGDKLKRLCLEAGNRGINVVPKLNFSQGSELHNRWFRPYEELYDNDKFWQIAFEIIDELINVCSPVKCFHIGMDEDNRRSHRQYVEAICRLHDGLKKRKLRTMIWNDSALAGGWAETFAEKCMAAEKSIPKDIIQVLWCYWQVIPGHVQRLVRQGFEVWVAPGNDQERIEQWKKVVCKHGAKGMLTTTWIPCQRQNRQKLLNVIRR